MKPDQYQKFKGVAMKKYILLGVCGLYCGSCSHYKVTQPEGRSFLYKKGQKMRFLRNVMAAVQIKRQNTAGNALSGLALKARRYYIADFAQIIHVKR